MTIETIHPFNALKTGSEIWVLPNPQYSQWVSSLDWQINFLIARSLRKTHPIISDDLKKILIEENINLTFKEPSVQGPILISTETYLPNKAILITRDNKNIEGWSQEIAEILKALRSKSARIFLPKEVIAENFNKVFQNEASNLSISIVEDVDPSRL